MSVSELPTRTTLYKLARTSLLQVVNKLFKIADNLRQTVQTQESKQLVDRLVTSFKNFM